LKSLWLSAQVPPELEECGLSKVTSASQGGQLAGASYQAGSTVRDQPELFGRIASTPTAWRIIALTIGGVGPLLQEGGVPVRLRAFYLDDAALAGIVRRAKAVRKEH
jgi:hypothetical protein